MSKLSQAVRLFEGLLLFWTAAVLSVGPSAAFAQDTANPAAVGDFNAAAALQNSGFYARAADKWSAFVQKHPTDSRLDRVHYYLGICQLHAKKYPEAVKTFQTVLSKYPSFASADGAQYNLGMASYQIAAASKKPEEFKTAAAALGAVADKHGTSKYAAKALYFQGEALFSAGEVQAAAVAYKRITDNYKTSPLLADALYALGTAQQELGQDAEAATTLKAFLDNPALAGHESANEVRLRLGMSLFNEKKYDDADKLFAVVAGVQDFPGADFAMLRQGQCRLETDKTAEAADVFKNLIQKFPNSPYLGPARLAMGKCYYVLDKLTEAQAAFQPLVSTQQDESAEATYWLGRTLIKLQKPQDALTLLDGAVKTHTTGEFVSYLQLARIDALYDLPDRRKETAKLYDDFAKQNPDHTLTAQAVYMAALAALDEEDYAAARTRAEAFLANAKYADHELQPAVLYVAAESHLLGAEAEGGGGDLAKAEQLYRQLVTKYPDHSRVARAHLRIAWCLHQLKKHDDARTYLSGVLGSLKDPEHVAEAQLLIGHSQHAAGRDQEAVTAYDAALSAKADWTRADEVLIASAVSLRALGTLDAAAERLGRLISGFAQSTYRAQAAYQLGEIALEQKKYDEAITRYRDVVDNYKESQFVAPASYGLAAACFAKEDYTTAVASLDKLLSGQPDAELAARGQFLRGLIHQRNKGFAAAVIDLKAFLDTKPEGDESIDAQYAMALCQIGLNQFDQATATLTSLLGQKPDYAHADKGYYELGHALLAQKKSSEAAAAFRTLAEKFIDSPLAPESWFHVGRFHEEAADKLVDEAQKTAEVGKAALAYSTGLAKATDKALREKLQYKLGDMQFRQGKFAEAAGTLTAQVTESPAGELAGPGRFLAAESLFRQDKFTEALPLFVKVADDKVEKYHAQSLYQAGVCAANLKTWPESQKHYQALIGLFPKFEQIAEARYGLAVALYNQDKLTEAQPIFEEVTNETETETAAKARFMIGEIAFSQKKYEDAVVEYLTVASGYPYLEWQAQSQFETGRCLVELGQKDKAIAAFQTVIDKHPTHSRAADAQKQIDSLK